MLNLFYCCVFVFVGCGIAPPETPPTPERAAHERQVACNALVVLPYMISASDLHTALDAYNEAVKRKDRQSSRQLYMDLLIATCKYDNQVRRITCPLKLYPRTMHNTLVIRIYAPTTRSVQIEQNLQILDAAKKALKPEKSTACMTPLDPDALPSYEYMAALARYCHTALGDEAETQIPARSLLFLNCAREQDDLSHQEGYKEVTAHLTNVLRRREITTNDLEWLRVISSNKCEFAYTLTKLVNEVRQRRGLHRHLYAHNPEASRYLQQYLCIDAPDDSSITDLLARIGRNSPLYRPVGLLQSQGALPSAAADLEREQKTDLSRLIRKCVYMSAEGCVDDAENDFDAQYVIIFPGMMAAGARRNYQPQQCDQRAPAAATQLSLRNVDAHNQAWQLHDQQAMVTRAATVQIAVDNTPYHPPTPSVAVTLPADNSKLRRLARYFYESAMGLLLRSQL